MQTSNETLMFSHKFVNQAHASVHVDKLFWWMMGCCTKLRLRTPWWWQGIISCLRIVYSVRLGLALKITNDHTDGKCLLNLKISGSKIRIKKKKEPWNRMNGMRYTFVGFFVTFSLFWEIDSVLLQIRCRKEIAVIICMYFGISQGYDWKISIMYQILIINSA